MAKTISPLFTTFDLSAVPTNLLTVSEWNTFSRAVLGTTNWVKAARHYATQVGGALVMKADDSLVVFTKLADGRIRRKTYAPNKWRAA